MRRKLTIKDMLDIAKCKGGECLSKKYVNSYTKLRWKCKEGHEWSSIYSNIEHGKWCPECAGNKKLTIEEMQELARSKGGECLSNNYANAISKLKWRCKEGHIFLASPISVKCQHWCPECVGLKKLTIYDMEEVAKSKGGECLSKIFTNSRSKLKWKCDRGHIWDATSSNIKNGTWCPDCGGSKRLSLENMRELAATKGGKCLSTEYINASTKLKWKCKEGHEWEVKQSHIKQGSWCPICSDGVSERICRKFFEEIFNEKFPKKRYEWLLSPKGEKLELDGYNEKLKLAFEYNGEQHYKKLNHISNDKFDYTKQCDQIKRDKCKEKVITLIEVPYTIKYEDMEKFILKETNSNIPFKNLNYKEWDIYSRDILNQLKEIVINKGGVCLSDRYINSKSKLTLKCKNGHIWSTCADNIKQGNWCPKCAIIKRRKNGL